MLSDSFTSWSISKSKGSTNPYVLFSDLADYEFDLPSLEEQKVLADKLWAAYRLKEGYKKLLCVTDEMVKSQFIEMFGNPLFNTKKWRWYSNINNVVTIVLGSTPNTKEPKYWDGDIKWITPAEMDDETFMINDTLRHITEFGVKSANLTKLPVGSVLFSTRAPIGKVGIAAAEMYCNQGFKSFICSNQVDSIFLYYTLKLNKEYLCSLGTGTTFKELSKKTVEGLKLGVPPIDLQKQFAIIYKQADKSKFGDFKSQFIEMFGDSPTKELRDVCIQSGEYGSNTPADTYDGNTRYVRITDINDYGKLNKELVSPRVIEEKYLLTKNDLLFARTGNTVGKTYLHEHGRMIYAGYLIRYRLKKEIMLPKFAFAFTHTSIYYDWVERTKKVGAQPNISAAQYDKMPIPVPSMGQQRAFVAVAEQADKSKSYVRIAFKNLESMLGYCIRQIS